MAVGNAWGGRLRGDSARQRRRGRSNLPKARGGGACNSLTRPRVGRTSVQGAFVAAEPTLEVPCRSGLGQAHEAVPSASMPVQIRTLWWLVRTNLGRAPCRTRAKCRIQAESPRSEGGHLGSSADDPEATPRESIQAVASTEVSDCGVRLVSYGPAHAHDIGLSRLLAAIGHAVGAGQVAGRQAAQISDVCHVLGVAQAWPHRHVRKGGPWVMQHKDDVRQRVCE